MIDIKKIEIGEIPWISNGERANEDNLNKALTKYLELDNLRAIEIDSILNLTTDELAGLESALVLKGNWDPLTEFPEGNIGWCYVVQSDGVVDGVSFNQNDLLLSIIEDPSKTTYIGSWIKISNSNAVDSVNGLTGAVTLDADNLPGLGTISKLNFGQSSDEVQDNQGNDNKFVAKELGKSLSDENYTLLEKDKLEALSNPDWTSSSGYSEILNKPTKLTDFVNDAGFISELTHIKSDWLANGGDAEILNKPTKVSDFDNDVGYAKISEIVHDKSDWLATTGDAEILNKPTKVSEFINDVGYVKSEDLVHAKSDWLANGGDAEILNKPTSLSDFINDIGIGDTGVDWNLDSGPGSIANKPEIGSISGFDAGQGNFEIRYNEQNDDRYLITDGLLGLENLNTIVSEGEFKQSRVIPSHSSLNYPTNKPGMLRVIKLKENLPPPPVLLCSISEQNLEYTLNVSTAPPTSGEVKIDVTLSNIANPSISLKTSAEAFSPWLSSSEQIAREAEGIEAISYGETYYITFAQDLLRLESSIHVEITGTALENTVKITPDPVYITNVVSGANLDDDLTVSSIVSEDVSSLSYDFSYIGLGIHQVNESIEVYSPWDSQSTKDTMFSKGIELTADQGVFALILRNGSESYPDNPIDSITISGTHTTDGVVSSIVNIGKYLPDELTSVTIIQSYHSIDGNMYLRKRSNAIWDSIWTLGSGQDSSARLINVTSIQSNIKFDDLGSVKVLVSNASVDAGLPVGWNCNIVAKGANVDITLSSEVILETGLSTLTIPKGTYISIIKITANEWITSSNSLSVTLAL